MNYITKDEVAALLRVSLRTVTTYMSQGLLPQPLQLGRKLLWDEGSLMQFLQARVATPAVTQPMKPVRRGRPRKVCV